MDHTVWSMAKTYKGGPYPSHFLFEINVGRSGSDIEQFSPSIDFESIWQFIIQYLTRFMSDPLLSDIYLNDRMAWVWTTLKDLAAIARSCYAMKNVHTMHSKRKYQSIYTTIYANHSIWHSSIFEVSSIYTMHHCHDLCVL